MNNKRLGDMQNAIVRLSPAPLLIGEDGKAKPLDVLWTVAVAFGKGARRQIVIETLSQALGLRLALDRDCGHDFREEDLRHPSFKQGLFMLRAQWMIPPEGKSPWRVPAPLGVSISIESRSLNITGQKVVNRFQGHPVNERKGSGCDSASHYNAHRPDHSDGQDVRGGRSWLL